MQAASYVHGAHPLPLIGDTIGAPPVILKQKPEGGEKIKVGDVVDLWVGKAGTIRGAFWITLAVAAAVVGVLVFLLPRFRRSLVSAERRSKV